MDPRVESIIAQLADPEEPWVWLPTETEPAFWDQLAHAARRDGFGIIDLDHEGEITGVDSLLAAVKNGAHLATWTGSNLNALKDALTGLPDTAKGWTILLRNPDALCDSDPETFEDLLDIVETVNEIKAAKNKPGLTLVTLDAEEDSED